MGAENVVGAGKAAAGASDGTTSVLGAGQEFGSQIPQMPEGGAGGLVQSPVPIQPPPGAMPPSASDIAAKSGASSMTEAVEDGVQDVADEADVEDESEAGDEELEAGEQPLVSEALGQGGTSLASDTSMIPAMSSAGIATAQSSDPASMGGDVTKAAAAGASVAATSQVLTLIALMNYLKLLMAMAQAALQNMWAMAVAFVTNLASSAASFFVGVGTTVSNALGISAMAGAVTSAVSAGIAIGALVLGLFAVGSGPSAAETATVAQSCLVRSEPTVAAADPTDVQAVQLSNAKVIYSVLAAWGMSDANIAGMLGNFQAESGIDATAVEGHSASYAMSDDKHAAALDISKGIGLGQWTGGRNTNLRAFASTIGQNWWSLNTQLAYLLSSGEGSNANIIQGMITTDLGDPTEAAIYFHDQWERSADTEQMKQRRAGFAGNWFSLMSGWEADSEFAASVLEQSGATVDEANIVQVAKAKSECRGLDNTSVVLADGGMDSESAQALINLYNAEGDAFLDGRYGNRGGPGSCGDDHAMNCVSFTTYFLNKYTSVQQYPGGNGIDVASNTARVLGAELSSVPSAYSIGSGPGSGAAGHTLVVLAVNGDQVVVGEAGYCQFGGRVSVRSAASMMSQGWEFVDIADVMLPADEVKSA